MARKKAMKKKARKLDATHRFLYYELSASGVGVADDIYIDIAAGLSAVNRKLYRQGRTYHVANVTVHDTDGDCDITLNTIPNNYTSVKAWRTVYDAWCDQRARALDNSLGKVTGKWADFKVGFNQDSLDADGQQDNLYKLKPVNSKGEPVNMFGADDSEWMYSLIATQSATGTEYPDQYIWMLGETDVATQTVPPKRGIGAITETMKLMQQPEVTPATGDLSGSFILGMNPTVFEDNTDVLANIEIDNDAPPYGMNYPLGAQTSANNGNPGNDTQYGWTVREGGITSSSYSTQVLGGFPLPLGLLHVEVKSADTNKVGLLIELVPGTYKGVHAESWV